MRCLLFGYALPWIVLAVGAALIFFVAMNGGPIADNPLVRYALLSLTLTLIPLVIGAYLLTRAPEKSERTQAWWFFGCNVATFLFMTLDLVDITVPRIISRFVLFISYMKLISFFEAVAINVGASKLHAKASSFGRFYVQFIIGMVVFAFAGSWLGFPWQVLIFFAVCLIAIFVYRFVELFFLAIKALKDHRIFRPEEDELHPEDRYGYGESESDEPRGRFEQI